MIAKIPAPANKRGLFTKDDFSIEIARGFVLCPAREHAFFDPDRLLKAHKVVIAKFDWNACSECPLRADCTESNTGRTIRIRPHEAKLRAERKYQKTTEFKETYSRRALVEQKISQCTRHGGRASRFIGRAKTVIACDKLTHVRRE